MTTTVLGITEMTRLEAERISKAMTKTRLAQKAGIRNLNIIPLIEARQVKPSDETLDLLRAALELDDTVDLSCVGLLSFMWGDKES